MITSSLSPEEDTDKFFGALVACTFSRFVFIMYCLVLFLQKTEYLKALAAVQQIHLGVMISYALISPSAVSRTAY